MKYLVRSRHRAFKDGFEYAIVDRRPPKHRETLDYDVKVFVVLPALEDFSLRGLKALDEAGFMLEA